MKKKRIRTIKDSSDLEVAELYSTPSQKLKNKKVIKEAKNIQQKNNCSKYAIIILLISHIIFLIIILILLKERKQLLSGKLQTQSNTENITKLIQNSTKITEDKEAKANLTFSEIYQNNNKYNYERGLEQYEIGIYENIKNRLGMHDCCAMWKNQKEFINGIIRKFRPKKLLELGVGNGGSSIIMLNAINDIEGSHLYSIDIDKNRGYCVKRYFSEFLNKWTFFGGNIASYFMPQIGKDIDLVLIDTSHFPPGEILDFLMVLPYLKEEAVVLFHDISNQITVHMSNFQIERYEWAPYQIFNLIRGKKYLPSGDPAIVQDIGAIQLEKNQNKYIYDYFRALGIQWNYLYNNEQFDIIRKEFKKYYDRDCNIMYEIAVKFNKEFVAKHQLSSIYGRYAINPSILNFDEYK